MPASFMKKTMAYLGLVDDDYDDYDDYESRSAATGRVSQRTAVPEEIDQPPAPPQPSPRIRTLTRDEANGTAAANPVSPRAAVPTSSVRPISHDSSGRVCTSWRRDASPTPRRSPTG